MGMDGACRKRRSALQENLKQQRAPGGDNCDDSVTRSMQFALYLRTHAMPSITPVAPLQSQTLHTPSHAGPLPTAPKKDAGLRVDILVRSASQPAEPGALSLEGESVSRVVLALQSWSSAAQALLAAMASLPPFIKDMTRLLRDTMTQLLEIVGSKGKQMQVAAADVYKAVRA